MLLLLAKRLIKTPKKTIRLAIYLLILIGFISMYSGRRNQPIIMDSDEPQDITVDTVGPMLREYKHDYYPGILRSHSPRFLELEEKLFKWTLPAFAKPKDMLDSYKGKGIVICVSNQYFTLALATINSIRRVFNCQLPIEVFYSGDEDLNLKYREKLEQISQTTVIDIRQKFNDTYLKLTGWSIKPFALLASTFSESILIDADTVFFQSPELLFLTKEYKSTGSLFFRDRTLKMYSSKDIKNAPTLIQQLIDKPLFKLNQHNRIALRQSFHEQESGVVVVNKFAHFFGMLSACTLNYGNMGSIVQNHFWGEKESFWLGFEIVNEAYSFNRWLPGASGSRKNSPDQQTLCSQQLLHVYDLVPFWYIDFYKGQWRLSQAEILPRKWLGSTRALDDRAW